MDFIHLAQLWTVEQATDVITYGQSSDFVKVDRILNQALSQLQKFDTNANADFEMNKKHYIWVVKMNLDTLKHVVQLMLDRHVVQRLPWTCRTVEDTAELLPANCDLHLLSDGSLAVTQQKIG